MPKYIDADVLRKRMEQIAEESKPAATARPMREDTPSELLRYGTARAMIEWLDEIPAADVEPVKHGHWINMGDFEQCSVCTATHLKEFTSYYGKTTWIKTPRCHQCGARMDAEPPKEGKNENAGL